MIKAKGAITGSGTVVMPDSVTKADIYVTGLSSGSILIQIADPSTGTYVTDQTNGTVTEDGRYTLDMAAPAQVQCIGSSAVGSVVYMVGI